MAKGMLLRAKQEVIKMANSLSDAFDFINGLMGWDGDN